jgi:crotonobetainyl-CoA:carnitine CoA-transferase CaiB-like acyl-CoA transferase
VTPLLSGVSVLDLSIWRPGPYATSLLCALGADVLKVEPPGGDPMRHYAGLFESVNGGKRSVVLDLKDPSGQARARSLASEADVVVEGFRPGVMQRLGLDESVVRSVNQRVIYCSISGYGQTGPLANLPGHDVNYQAWAGSLSPDGAAAVMPPLPVADLASGMTAAFGICAALLGRSTSGQGTYLDISMTDVMSTWTGDVGADSEGGSTSVPGYGIFATEDGGQVALGIVNEQHFWSALCHELGLEAMADLTFEQRTRRAVELGHAVGASIAPRARDELVTALVRAGVPAAPVLDRPGMIANAPFPRFPIRTPVGSEIANAPSLDQHRGEGFRRPK